MTAGGRFVSLPPGPPPGEVVQSMLDARMMAWCGSQVPGVVVTFSADAWHVLCPAGTTFDAAEALRLELVARVPVVVVVDVQIAPAPLGALSPEDEAGVRLFELQRAERLAPKTSPSDDEPFPWDEPEGGAS